jgi:phosphotransferase system enzyme I (PtsP)
LGPKIDFLSIGTNDLTQFLLAADRAHPKLAQRYDWISASILRFLRRVVTSVEPYNIDLTVCGEMGGRQLEALALLAIGIRRLSITPAAVGPIKAMVRSLDIEQASAKMAQMLAHPPADMRATLLDWATSEGVELG